MRMKAGAHHKHWNELFASFRADVKTVAESNDKSHCDKDAYRAYSS